MKLALITPVAHLNFVHSLPGRFAIAPIAHEYPQYAKFYTEQQQLGIDVILDNGVFENIDFQDSDFFEVIQQMLPKVVIAPDKINATALENYERATTFAETLYSLPFVKDTDYKPEIMFVAQCQRSSHAWYDMTDIFEKFSENPLLTWLGICRDFAYQIVGEHTQTVRQEVNRLALGIILKHSGFLQRFKKEGKKIHFLGVGDDVHLLQHAHWVDSADTASFFYQAMNGQVLGNVGVLYSKYRRPYNYFELDYGKLSANIEARITTNCQEAQRYAYMATRTQKDIEGGRI